ncbi:MAG: hypothetical protein ACR2Q4_24605, partial [Geminicoccaceae bacterium]
LDSDDFLWPHAATEILALWTPTTVKVQYALQAIDAEGNQIHAIFPKYPHVLTPETVKAELLRAGVYPATTTSGTAFSRQFLRRVMPIPPDYRCDIDDALNTAAPLYGDVITLRKVLGCYRVHERNTSAHAELTAERFERYVGDCEGRQRYLRDQGMRLGIALPPDLIENDLVYWENRLAAAVMRPEQGRLRLLRPAVSAAARSILDPGQRAMHVTWAIVLVLTPKWVAKKALAQRFIFNQRSRLIEGLLHRIWRLGAIIGSRSPVQSEAGTGRHAEAGSDDAGSRTLSVPGRHDHTRVHDAGGVEHTFGRSQHLAEK